jgi:hypothetical protein
MATTSSSARLIGYKTISVDVTVEECVVYIRFRQLTGPAYEVKQRVALRSGGVVAVGHHSRPLI